MDIDPICHAITEKAGLFEDVDVSFTSFQSLIQIIGHWILRTEKILIYHLYHQSVDLQDSKIYEMIISLKSPRWWQN